MKDSIMLLNPKKKNRTWMFLFGAAGSALLLFFDAGFKRFYVGNLGMTEATYAFIMVVFAIWNAINDPLASFLSDRTKTKIGRRIPYMLFGAIPFGLTFILMFNPIINLTGASQLKLGIYAFIVLFLYDLLYSVVYSNYMMLIPEMFREQAKLRKFNLIRYAIMLPLSIGVFLAADILQNSGAKNMWLMGFIPGIAMMICIIFSSFGARENPVYSKTFNSSVWKSIKQAVKNRNFLAFIGYHSLYNVAKALVVSNIAFLGLFISGKFLGFTVGGTLMLGLTTIAMVVFMPVWNWIMKKFSADWMNVICLIIGMIACLIMQFANTIGMVAVAAVVLGISQSGYSLAHDLFNARMLDEDFAKTKQRSEGTYAGAGAFFDRLFSMIGPLMVAAMAGLVGGALILMDNAGNPILTADGRQQLTEAGKIVYKMACGVLPMILMGLSALVSATCYKLRGKRWAEVEQQVRELDAELAKQLVEDENTDETEN